MPPLLTRSPQTLIMLLISHFCCLSCVIVSSWKRCQCTQFIWRWITLVTDREWLSQSAIDYWLSLSSSIDYGNFFAWSVIIHLSSAFYHILDTLGMPDKATLLRLHYCNSDNNRVNLTHTQTHTQMSRSYVTPMSKEGKIIYYRYIYFLARLH